MKYKNCLNMLYYLKVNTPPGAKLGLCRSTIYSKFFFEHQIFLWAPNIENYYRPKCICVFDIVFVFVFVYLSFCICLLLSIQLEALSGYFQQFWLRLIKADDDHDDFL